MKTIEEWYNTFPEPYRSQALANMWWEDRHKLEPDPARALHQGFNWGRSKEGVKYWGEYYKSISQQLNK